MIPTVGFNMRKVTKGNVTMKLWDIGGQPRFRSMWERYCRGVNAIVYVAPLLLLLLLLCPRICFFSLRSFNFDLKKKGKNRLILLANVHF